MNLSLLTDLYQLTMAYGYWKQGWHDQEAVFHLFFRKHPFKGHYTIVAGLEQAIDYLQNLRLDVDDIQYLANLRDYQGRALFGESFLNHLQRMDFRCDVDAVPEGTIVFPHEPLLRIRGPLLQAQLVETALLNLINFPSLIATKAARICQAAQGDSVIEFGLRRAQGPDGGLTASRAAYIGGCHATSNVLAGRRYGIPVKGTNAHSWVMAFEDELEAFRQYAAAMPGNCVFLVDTYDTMEGVEHAITVGGELRNKGYEMVGVRLDSGDLCALSQAARKMLDEAGFPDAAIIASDSLDEYRIQTLKASGAKINMWGIGTRLATAYDQPALGGVYKLAAIRPKTGDWSYRIKLSEQIIKVSNPGLLNTYRLSTNGQPVMDAIVNEAAPISDTLHTFDGQELPFGNLEREALLKPIFKKGELVYECPSIHDTRAYAQKQMALFADKTAYPTGLEGKLNELKRRLMEKAR